MIPPSRLREVAVKAADAGGEVLRRWFRAGDLQVRMKAENDFVTRADEESEAQIVAEIRRAFPGHEVLGEEGGLDPSVTSPYRWLVDPLDGTTNFVQGLPVFAVSVACQHRGRSVAAAVLDPIGGDRFDAAEGQGASWNQRPMHVSDHPGLAGAFLATGYPFRAHAALEVYLKMFRDVFREARAIRRCGAAALDLSYVASGVYDGFFEIGLSPWDFAAAELLVREAGGRITDLDGGEGFYAAGNVVAGAPGVQMELLQNLGRNVDESILRRTLEIVDSARLPSVE